MKACCKSWWKERSASREIDLCCSSDVAPVQEESFPRRRDPSETSCEMSNPISAPGVSSPLSALSLLSLLSGEGGRGRRHCRVEPGTARLLHVGCGSSLLGLHLHRAGYEDVVNVDYVSAVTEQMAAQYGAPGITWEACDLTAPTRWAPASFDVVRWHAPPCLPTPSR